MKHKLFKIFLGIILLGLLGFGFLTLYSEHQIKKIPTLSFSDALEYTTKDNPDALITVGIVKDGEGSYRVYGENAEELPKEQHIYEIGSITKTFTAALINQGVDEGLIQLNDSIDRYLSLPKGKRYPTIEALLTHTSGYQGYYFESPMISNFIHGRNSFYGVTKEMTIKRLGQLSTDQEACPFVYSNFGYAVLGLILEEVYGKDYPVLMNAFIQNDLGLQNTKISDGKGDLGKYWDWNDDDAYLSAGGLTSTIDDMLSYATLQMENSEYRSCHKKLKPISSMPKKYQIMGISMDAVGMSWIIDEENHRIWHNGGTGNYNCYMGFDLETKTAVVILSNLPPGYRIPATVLGPKLLDELND